MNTTYNMRQRNGECLARGKQWDNWDLCAGVKCYSSARGPEDRDRSLGSVDAETFDLTTPEVAAHLITKKPTRVPGVVAWPPATLLPSGFEWLSAELETKTDDSLAY